MNTPARRIAAAAMSGATALALCANPVLANAAPNGVVQVTADGNTITVEVTNITSDFRVNCQVIITDNNPATTFVETSWVDLEEVLEVPYSASGTFTTTQPDGDYLVNLGCHDYDGFAFLTPAADPENFNLGDGVPVTLPATATPPPGGGYFGSVRLGLFGSS